MTVGSLAIRATRRPSIVARPVTTPSAPRPSSSQLASSALLGEGAGVDQALDPLAHRQLALLGGLLVVALRAAGEGGLECLGREARASRIRDRRAPRRLPMLGLSSRDASPPGPARSTWAPSGRPSTSWAAREASIRRGRSIPVSTPISCSIETTSSLETLPVEPGGTGQPPSSPKLDSKDSTPSSSAASTLARPWPRVLWKWAVSSTPAEALARGGEELAHLARVRHPGRVAEADLLAAGGGEPLGDLEDALRRHLALVGAAEGGRRSRPRGAAPPRPRSPASAPAPSATPRSSG